MNRISAIASIGLVLGLLGLSSLAAAQAPDLPVPPKPKETALLGNPDAGCFMATIDIYSRASKRLNELPADKRETAMELPLRQLAFYAGKAAAGLGQSGAEDAVRTAASVYTDTKKFPQPTPTALWCYRSYLEQSGKTFPSLLDKAIANLGSQAGRDKPRIQRQNIDPNAVCLIMISIALPSTMEAAKADPNAAKGVRALGRGQHYYMGRLYGQEDPSTIVYQLSNAYQYSDQLGQAKDNKTGHEITMACLAEYETSLQAMLSAVEGALPE